MVSATENFISLLWEKFIKDWNSCKNNKIWSSYNFILITKPKIFPKIYKIQLQCPSFVKKKNTLQSTDYRGMIQISNKYMPINSKIHRPQWPTYDKLFIQSYFLIFHGLPTDQVCHKPIGITKMTQSEIHVWKVWI